ncbi:MAG: hypothetical protein ABUS79_26975 [Pseudomonadota bacterium]
MAPPAGQAAHPRAGRPQPFLARANWKTTLLNQSDKQHPTDAGYVIMGDTWYPAIKPFLH